MNDKVSVIVPIYNAEKYINRCIDSIINQSHKNLEIILVDDGSQDNCGKICDEYEVKDKRIKVIHKENGGVSSARNAGLKQVTGDYIAWVDADDYIMPDMYMTMISIVKKANADVVSINYTSSVPHMKKKVKTKVLRANISVKHLLKRRVSPMLWDKMYKRELFEGVFFDANIGEDFFANYIILNKSHKVVVTNYIGYIYNVRENSISHSSKYYMELINNAKRISELEIQKGKNKKEANYSLVYDCCLVLNNCLSKNEKQYILCILKESILKCPIIKNNSMEWKVILKGLSYLIKYRYYYKGN